MKLKQVWTSNLKEAKDKEEFLQLLFGSRRVLERLEYLLERKIPDRVLEREYDNPSWAYKQADQNGYERALREVLDLISLDKSE